jgi:hypothetical protein
MPDLHLIKQEEQVGGISAGGFASGRSARCVCYIIPEMLVLAERRTVLAGYTKAELAWHRSSTAWHASRALSSVHQQEIK